jgi:hypothetical protein
MKTLRITMLFAIFVLIKCAVPNSLSSEFDESIDFDSYSTYVVCVDDFFVENTSYPNYDNKEVRQLIGNEIAVQMERRGHKTNVAEPQLQAGFKILLRDEEVIFSNCDEQSEYEYWDTCTINKEIYTQETLVFYVSDINKNQVIWQAKIDCDLNKSKKELHKYISQLVAKVFNEYPTKRKIN